MNKIIMLLLFIPLSVTLAQSAPDVGEPLPDFTLNKITHYKKGEASRSDFFGKWLFLDFWFTGCTTCIQSFPKISTFQEKFRDKALFIMVGHNDQNNKGIEALYEKFHKKQNLLMASAYDSILFKRWNVLSMPHIIIADPAGVVRVITDGRDLTTEKLNDLINGKKVSFYRKDIERPEFNPSALTGGRSKLIYRSLLTHWNGESQKSRTGIKDEIKYLKDSTGMNFSMVPLKWLYNWAYMAYYIWDLPKDSLFGKVYPNPVLEMNNKSLFEYDFKNNVGKGTYCYSLTAPPSQVSVNYVMHIMQNDLKNAFGYDVVIEDREMQVWKLIAKSGAEKKLKTKGGATYFSSKDSSGGASGFEVKNESMAKVLEMIMRYIGIGQPPWFDETGITNNIDIEIDALLTDWNQIRDQLKKNDLDLVKGTREMKVIVIRDPLPDENK